MSSRSNLDRPQPFLENPIELLMTTETATPDAHIIKNFDGDFKVVIAVFSSDVDFETRVAAHISSRDGSDVAATDWVACKTFSAAGDDVGSLSRHCEYRCTTSSAGSRVFLTDAQWQGVV